MAITKVSRGLLSTGIVDNSNATAITIDSSEDVTLAGELKFADSKKAIFGAGSDLQIYHDGNNSIISESGDGGLRIETSGVATSGFYKENSNPDEAIATFEPDGPVTLYHNNVSKLATTSTGIEVSGEIDLNTDDDLRLRFYDGGTFKAGLQVATSADDMITGTADGDFAIRSQGNMLFSTDGNAEKFKIGTNGYLVAQSASQIRLVLGSTGNSSNNTSNWIRGTGSDLGLNAASGNIGFEVGGTEKLRIQSGGGISFNGDSAAANALDDYEEGDWTPTIGAGGAEAQLTAANGYLTVQSSTYRKIGTTVHVQAYLSAIDYSEVTSGAYMLISGLPFGVKDYSVWTAAYENTSKTYGGYAHSNNLYYMAADGTGGHSNGYIGYTAMDDFGDNKVLMLQCTYNTN